MTGRDGAITPREPSTRGAVDEALDGMYLVAGGGDCSVPPFLGRSPVPTQVPGPPHWSSDGDFR